MPYTDEHKSAMKEIGKTECFKEFSHQVLNDLTAAMGTLYLTPETPTQAEMFRERSIQAIQQTVERFREIL